MPLNTLQMAQTNLPEALKSMGGKLYGVVLNDQASLARVEPELDQPPYKQPPNAPILYIKPRNTIASDGASISLPEGEREVEVGATLGLLIGEKATRATADTALSKIAGVALFVDLSLPHDSYYRPAIREKCFDGACPVSSQITPYSQSVFDAGINLSIRINGKVVENRGLIDLIRTPAQLIADVSEFMSLSPGDVLLLGVSYQAPKASIGDNVIVSAKGIGTVGFSLIGAGGMA